MLGLLIALMVGMGGLSQASSNETDDWAKQSVLSAHGPKKSPGEHQSPPDKKDDDLVRDLYQLPVGVTEFLVGRVTSATLINMKNANGLSKQPLIFSEQDILTAFIDEKRSDQPLGEVVKAQLTQITHVASTTSRSLSMESDQNKY